MSQLIRDLLHTQAVNDRTDKENRLGAVIRFFYDSLSPLLCHRLPADMAELPVRNIEDCYCGITIDGVEWTGRVDSYWERKIILATYIRVRRFLFWSWLSKTTESFGWHYGSHVRLSDVIRIYKRVIDAEVHENSKIRYEERG